MIGNNDWNNRTIWSCATSPWYPLKRARPKSKLGHIIQLNPGECRPVQAVKQPVTFESFDENASPFRQTMVDYLL